MTVAEVQALAFEATQRAYSRVLVEQGDDANELAVVTMILQSQLSALLHKVTNGDLREMAAFWKQVIEVIDEGKTKVTA